MTIYPLREGAPPNYGGTFVKETLDLTGKPWLNCSFLDCTLRLDRFEHPIVGCVLERSILIGIAWGECWPWLWEYDEKTARRYLRRRVTP